MRKIIALAATAAALSACQTMARQDPHWGYSGTGDERYADERTSAEAMAGIFMIDCVGDKIRYRIDRVQALIGDCERFVAPPRLDRQRVLSNEETILLVKNSDLGVVGEGTVILYDESRMIPIEIGSVESFGDVISRDTIIINGGTINGSACGMTLWSKELTLDWAHGRVARERMIPRAQPSC